MELIIGALRVRLCFVLKLMGIGVGFAPFEFALEIIVIELEVIVDTILTMVKIHSIVVTLVKFKPIKPITITTIIIPIGIGDFILKVVIVVGLVFVVFTLRTTLVGLVVDLLIGFLVGFLIGLLVGLLVGLFVGCCNLYSFSWFPLFTNSHLFASEYSTYCCFLTLPNSCFATSYSSSFGLTFASITTYTFTVTMTCSSTFAFISSSFSYCIVGLCINFGNDANFCFGFLVFWYVVVRDVIHEYHGQIYIFQHLGRHLVII